MGIRLAALAACALLPFAALAADDGELWEVTTQMNIPGMPAGMAGMGGAPQRVCNGKDPKEDAMRRPDMQKCKVVDMKQTATRMTLTMSCPEGQAVIDQTYNAARTEYKGTMTMKTRDGDMVMNMSGRKVGTCDVQQARKAREEKSARMKGEMEAQIAVGRKAQADQQKQMAAHYAKTCDEAVKTMDARQFPTRASFKGVPKEMQGGCDARRTEFCKKFQTEAGFSLAARHQGNLAPAGELCAVQPGKLQATLCSGALKNDSLDFLSRHCPVEVKQAGAKLCPKAVQTEAWHFVAQNCPADSKALFAKNCAGRQYTSLQNRKQRDMCTTLARLDDEDSGSGSSASSAPAQSAEAKKASTSEKVQQTFGKGLDKLKGLFGR